MDNYNTITNTKDGGVILSGSTTSKDRDLAGKNSLEAYSAWMIKIDMNKVIVY